MVAVKTADCIPILLVDERHRAVAAVHAGWRGTVARIAAGAVEAMARASARAPADLHAAIGPGIGKCCYEVGPEVAAQFGGQGRAHIDLPDANRRQLVEAGVTPRTNLRVELVHHVPGARSFIPSGATRKRPAACIRLPEFDRRRPGQTPARGTVKRGECMFTWICPQCGREVPPAYNECPDCSNKAAPAGGVPVAGRRPRRRRTRRHQQPPAPQQPYYQQPQQPPQQAYYPPQPQAQPGAAVLSATAPATGAPPQQQPPAGYYGAPAPSRGMNLPVWAADHPLRGGNRRSGLRSDLAAVQLIGGSAGNGPAPTATVESPAAKPGRQTNPLQRYIEISGVRFVEDPKKKTTLAKFVLINHSERGYQRPGRQRHHLGPHPEIRGRRAGTFTFTTDLAPMESKEMTVPLNTKRKIYELARLAERDHRRADHRARGLSGH